MHLILPIRDRLLVSSGLAGRPAKQLWRTVHRADADFGTMVVGVFPKEGRHTKLVLVRTEDEALANTAARDAALYDRLQVTSDEAAEAVDATDPDPLPAVVVSPLLDEWLADLEPLAAPPPEPDGLGGPDATFVLVVLVVLVVAWVVATVKW